MLSQACWVVQVHTPTMQVIQDIDILTGSIVLKQKLNQRATTLQSTSPLVVCALDTFIFIVMMKENGQRNRKEKEGWMGMRGEVGCQL